MAFTQLQRYFTTELLYTADSMSHTIQSVAQLFTPEDRYNKYRLLHQLASPSTDQESASMEKALLLLIHTYQNDIRALGAIRADHSFEVACLVATQFQSSTQAIIGALLHEMIAKEDVPLATIQREFGDNVSNIVAGVARLVEAAYLSRADLLARLREIISRPTPDHIHILLVSMADCLENLYRLDSFLPKEQQLWTDLAHQVYAPLASRLGMHRIQSDLEDLYLKFTRRTIYDRIVTHIQADRSTKEGFLASFIAPIHLALQQQGVIHTIQARTKSISSIYRKILKDHAPLEALHDLYAIRVVFDSRLHDEYANCWLICKLVSTLYAALPHKFKNWLSYPKASGYEALHLTVMTQAGQMVEVQIRSRRMDTIAEEGSAAHWRYKSVARIEDFAAIDGLWLRKVRKFLKIPSIGNPIHITTSNLYIR